MAFTVRETAHIFEDPTLPPSPTKTPTHRRVPSVGDVLRGRRKDASPMKPDRSKTTDESPPPLRERHINSPPQQKRLPLQDEEGRPTMHKKTGSSVSIKEFIWGKDRANDTSSVSSREETLKKSPKKMKSSTNLAGLLKKRSRKDLKDESKNQENIPPPSPSREARTPIWAQYATQPVQGTDGILHYPQTGRAATGQHPDKQENNTHNLPEHCQASKTANASPIDYKPPQRPYLEHRSSRSSIFTENLDEENEPTTNKPGSQEQPEKLGATPEQQLQRPQLRSQDSASSTSPDKKANRSSRVLEALSTLSGSGRQDKKVQESKQLSPKESMSPQQLDTELEKVLDSLNIPPNLRDNMRNLKADVKMTLIRGERIGSSSSSGSVGESSDIRSSARSPQKKDSQSTNDKVEQKEEKRPRSRSRPRSRVFGKRDDGVSDKQEKSDSSVRSRSKSRPQSRDMSAQQPIYSRSMPSSASLASLGPVDSVTAPEDFIHYMKEVRKPSLVEVGKLHKLRILLRNKSITWTDAFVTQGGMDELVALLYRILEIEWRDEHDDNLLHEVLLCLKALCTTTLALLRLEAIEQKFFTTLLAMLFDEERKGPSEFTTRGVVITLLFAHLSAAVPDGERRREERARSILNLLRDPAPEDGKKPPEFVSQMHVSRPYRIWCKEVVNVTKEVFWIFLHHMNVVPINEVDASLEYHRAHYPPLRPPHPAAPYVGGVEWDATQYLATHLDLLNGILASLTTKDERNALRRDMKNSGFEKVMGGSLRTCKEKFYGGVHDGLKVWVAAAKADGWFVEDVRAGPPREAKSPQKSPNKKQAPAPQISLDVGIGNLPKINDGWV